MSINRIPSRDNISSNNASSATHSSPVNGQINQHRIQTNAMAGRSSLTNDIELPRANNAQSLGARKVGSQSDTEAVPYLRSLSVADKEAMLANYSNELQQYVQESDDGNRQSRQKAVDRIIETIQTSMKVDDLPLPSDLKEEILSYEEVELDLSELNLSRLPPLNTTLLNPVNSLKLNDSNIELLPDLSSLSKLYVLDLRECCYLRDLGQLPPNLKALKLDRSPIETLPDLAHLKELSELELCDCDNLTRLGALPPNLTSLLLYNASIRSLPNLSHLYKLRELDIGDCPHLRDLGPLPPKLTLLKLDDTGIENLSDLSILPELTQLDLCDCPNLRVLSPLPTSLTVLKFYRLGIQAQLDVKQFNNLPKLDIDECPNVTMIR